MITLMTDNNDDTTKSEVIVFEQTLLRVDPVYLYKVPPVSAYSAGGHRAESWNLANPIQTCSLQILRRDSTLRIRFYAHRPKKNGPEGALDSYLFCESCLHVQLSVEEEQRILLLTQEPEQGEQDKNQEETIRIQIHTYLTRAMEYWLQSVVDSSRYFVLRISSQEEDPTKRREAWIGVGFRERTDATNFKMSVQEYQRGIEKDVYRNLCSQRNEMYGSSTKETKKSTLQEGLNEGDVSIDTSEPVSSSSSSPLCLQEGQKIHIHINTSHRKKTILESTPKSNGSLPLKKLLPPPLSTTSASHMTSPTTKLPSNATCDVDTTMIQRISIQEGKEEEEKETVTPSRDTVVDLLEEDWNDFESAN